MLEHLGEDKRVTLCEIVIVNLRVSEATWKKNGIKNIKKKKGKRESSYEWKAKSPVKPFPSAVPIPGPGVGDGKNEPALHPSSEQQLTALWVVLQSIFLCFRKWFRIGFYPRQKSKAHPTIWLTLVDYWLLKESQETKGVKISNKFQGHPIKAFCQICVPQGVSCLVGTLKDELIYLLGDLENICPGYRSLAV